MGGWGCRLVGVMERMQVRGEVGVAERAGSLVRFQPRLVFAFLLCFFNNNNSFLFVVSIAVFISGTKEERFV